MIGIYMIENVITGEKYIGQSTDIEKRFKEHIYHKDSYIDQIIHEEGLSNFIFRILEICSEENLDYFEEYYINLYKTTYKGYGYNIVKGGQHNIGESNSNVKLTEKEVYDIRESYKNHERKYEVYERYKHKISRSYFSSLWEGNSWKHIHYDVYNEENLNYYKYETTVGEKSSSSIFTDEQVSQFRNRYVNESAKSIYDSVKDLCSYQTLQSILWGRSYKHLPVYDKKNKKMD